MDFFKAANPGILDLAPYQPGKPIEELERELGITGIVKLASNENPLGPTPRLNTDLAATLKEGARYPDGSAYELKRRLSGLLDCDMNQITIGNGSNDVLELLGRVFLGPGLNAVVSEHAFVVYGLVTRALGATLREVPCQNFYQDLDATLKAIDAQTRLVFIANPNNPTGTWVGKTALEAFLSAVPDSVIVVLDEAYVEYVEDADYPNGLELMDRYPNLVVTRTFSKAFGLAALRLGYSVSHPDIADLMNRIRQPFNVNSVALAAGLLALDDPEHVAEGVRINREGLAVLNAAFESLSLPAIPSAGNFVCFDVQSDALPVYQGLLERGVIVRPVGVYGLPNHLRVSVGTPSENQVFTTALKSVLG
ncbi:MAG: histidinol-phosphate transaminase [Pseudomonadales bacterium]